MWRANGKESRVNDPVSGQNTLALFAPCDHAGWSSRMCPRCSPAALLWSGVISELLDTRSPDPSSCPPRRLAPRTSGNGSGSWPTPDARDSQPEGYEAGLRRLEKYSTMGLQTAAKLWPTPHGMCFPNKRRAGPSGNELGNAVNRSLLPTPAARDYRTPSKKVGTPEYFREETAGIPLPEAVGGSLNPTWVEWLQGYPLGWTVCEGWATRSSRSVRSPSSAPSKRRKKG